MAAHMTWAYVITSGFPSSLPLPLHTGGEYRKHFWSAETHSHHTYFNNCNVKIYNFVGGVLVLNWKVNYVSNSTYLHELYIQQLQFNKYIY